MFVVVPLIKVSSINHRNFYKNLVIKTWFLQNFRCFLVSFSNSKFIALKHSPL